MLACASYADIVYTTSNGKMGFIGISSISDTLSADSPVVKYSDAADDSIVAHYYNEDGTSFVALIEPETDPSIKSGDFAFIFNVSDLTKPVDDGVSILTGTYDARSAAYSDNHRGLFLASGLNGEATISEYDTEGLQKVRSISYISSNDAMNMSTVLVNGSSIYGLVSRATSEDSLLLRFDGQLDNEVRGYSETKVRYDSELMTFGKDNRIFIAHSGGVDTFANGLSSSELVLVVSTDTPVKALCKDNDSGFYFMAQSPETGEQALVHYKSSSEVNEVDFGYTESFVSKAMYYDSDNKKFVAAIINDGIAIYDPDTDALIAEFTRDQLGGIPISMTAVTQNTGSTKGNSSSGCNVTGSGMLMILSAGYMLLRKRK